MKVYNVYEKVQMTGFTIQETIISGLYLWETRHVLRPGATFQREKTRKVMRHLVWVNCFIIFLDMALLATEYANLFEVQTVFKAAVYSIKLRFEFVVLNQLMDYVQARSSTFERSNDTPSRPNNPASRTRSFPLDSVKRGTLRSGENRNDGRTLSINNYSVSASKGVASPTGPRSMDGVLRTTEVHVVHGEPKLRDEDEQILNNSTLHGLYPTAKGHGEAVTVAPTAHTRTTTRSDSSPSSSIVEFAGKGVDFAGKSP